MNLEKDEKCISNILREVDKGIRSCQCGVDCDETGYEVKTSSYLWPSPKYEVCYLFNRKSEVLIQYLLLKAMIICFILQETAKETFRVRRDSTGSVSKDNLIQIGVYYQSLNTRMISEEPKYQVILLKIKIIVNNDH